MGALETGISENLVLDKAEKHITASLSAGVNAFDNVRSHDDFRQIVQDIEVEAYSNQRKIAEALRVIASLESDQERFKVAMSKMEGEELESTYQQMKEFERHASDARTDLQAYLKQIFGSVVDPMAAIKSFETARQALTRNALDMEEELPGYENIKAEDAGRNIMSDSLGKGTVVHVDPDQVLIRWEDGNEQWIAQEALAAGDIRLEDESGTAVESGVGTAQGPADSPEGTSGGADLERNPLMDYLQGYELEEDEQEGPKKAPTQSPSAVAPAKKPGLTMSAAESGNKLVWKDEGEEGGVAVGSVSIGGLRQSEWLSKPEAMKLAKERGLEFVSAAVGTPDDKPGATKKNPQEPESENQTPDTIKYRLDALDPMTKTWKEVGTYNDLDKAKEKEAEVKSKMPMTMETQITNLSTIADHNEKPNYETTPKGPEGDNDKQTVKEEQTPGVYPKKSSIRYRSGSWELWLANDKENSPHVTQDPAVVAHLLGRNFGWALRKSSKVMRWTKDSRKAYVVHVGAAK